MADRHDWHSWDNYLLVHDNYMSHYANFIEKNEFEFSLTESAILGQGTIFCKNGIEIIVRKELEISKRQNKI